MKIYCYYMKHKINNVEVDTEDTIFYAKNDEQAVLDIFDYISNHVSEEINMIGLFICKYKIGVVRKKDKNIHSGIGRKVFSWTNKNGMDKRGFVRFSRDLILNNHIKKLFKKK